MGHFLLDNPPASRQFHASRNAAVSGGVIVHTTEGVGGDDSAENTARFIARRSDPGSYHVIVDTNSSVSMMPDSYTAFGVAASGYNSTCWMIAIAARSSDLDPDNGYTQIEIDRCGFEIAQFWARNGIDARSAAKWIGEGTKSQPGLACHGDVQPHDRSDAWSRHPHRARFDQMLIDAILRQAGAAPAPQPAGDLDLAAIAAAIESAKRQVIRRGSRGDAVKWAQLFLNRHKDAGLVEDGVFGPATEAAVRRFQSDIKSFFNLSDGEMSVDGIVGPKTWFWLAR